MAKAVGIDAGAYELKIVELDGSFRRPKLSKVCIERTDIPAAGDDPEAVAATQAREVLKEAGIGRENLGITFPANRTVLREMTVPFVGTDQIRRVIKFEAEGEIHSHSVDDLVVDFHVLEELENETRVLIAAVPKVDLTGRVKAFEDAHIEPERIDLDAMALYRVAEWAGCFGEEVAQAAVEAAEAEAEGEDVDEHVPASFGSTLPGRGIQARLVADVGALSTRVVLVAGGNLIDIRAIPVGDDSLAKEVAKDCRISLEDARKAIFEVLETGADVPLEPSQVLPLPEDETAATEAEATDDDEFVLEDESETLPAEPVVPTLAVTVQQVQQAKDRFLKRLRRELLRFSAAQSRVDAIERVFLTGGGSALPGVEAVFADVFAAPIEPLDLLGRLAHDLDDEEALSIGPRLAVSVGLALMQLGGRGGFNFRREEFVYRKRFDRLKFPAAVACMLAILLPVFFAMRKGKELEELGFQYGSTYEFEDKGPGGRANQRRVSATHYGILNRLLTGERSPVARALEPVEVDKVLRQIEQTDTFKRLPRLKTILTQQLRDLQSKTGVYSNLQLRSGVYVISWFANQIQLAEPMLGKFLIESIDLDLSSERPTSPAQMKVTLLVFGEDYRSRESELRTLFERQFDDPACPFSAVNDDRPEDPFKGGTAGARLSWSFDVKLTFDAKPAD